MSGEWWWAWMLAQVLLTAAGARFLIWLRNRRTHRNLEDD